MSRTHKDHPNRRAAHQDLGARTLLGFKIETDDDRADEAHRAMCDYIRRGGVPASLMVTDWDAGFEPIKGRPRR